MRSPVSVYARLLSGKKWWYARFWDPTQKRYNNSRALEIPCEGRRGGRDAALKKAELLLVELGRSADPCFLDYIKAFWSDDSTYLRLKRVADKRPLSIAYVANNRRAIRLHISPCPFLAKLTLSALKAGHINDWKLWALEKGTGIRTVNYALQAIRVAVRHAVERGDLSTDPLRSVKVATESPKELGVLKPSEVEALARAAEGDPRVKAAVLLSVLAGLRRGEVRGLRWGDIDFEEHLIHVTHNYVTTEGPKGCKSGSSRDTVLLDPLAAALMEVAAVSPCRQHDNYVLFDINRSDRPMSDQIIKLGFNRMLKAIGIPAEQRKARILHFHSLRHTFVTISRVRGLQDSVIQALVGHRSSAMMRKYSHVGDVIDFAAAKAQLGFFATPEAGSTRDEA